MAKRKSKPQKKSLEHLLDSPDPVVKKMHEPEEVRIYVKQLKKALGFLPLGSRAYYYLLGEVFRANTQLKTLVAHMSTQSQRHNSEGASSDPRRKGT